MKVLLFDRTCAFLTPGGKTTHALKLKQEIAKLGVDIEFAKWWDASQSDFDIIHFLSNDVTTAKIAKEHGKKCFLSQILDFESSKTNIQKFKTIIKNHILDILPGAASGLYYWNMFQYMDCIQFMHKYDLETAIQYFPTSLKDSKTIIIPHAYDPKSLNISSHLNIENLNFPSKYLISCANISERKQSVLLAKYAKAAQVPIVFIGGKNELDSYWKKFEAEIDNRYVFYPGYVSDEWKDCIESNASGYVLLSKGESGCIAVYEAAAYKLPLLLSNLPWAWGYDSPTDIHFCDFQNNVLAIEQLKQFYKTAKKLDKPPFKIYSWEDIAKKYVEAYTHILCH